MRAQVLDGVAHTVGKDSTELRRRNAVAVRRRHGTHVVAELHVAPERGRCLGNGRGHAVVGKARDDQPLCAGVGARDAHRQVVGLAAGAGEHGMAQRVRHGGQQALRVIQDALVQVARVRVELRRLAGNGLHHLWMAMADRCHIVIRIEVALAVGVVKPDAIAAHDVQRLLVEQAVRRAEHAGAPLGQRCNAWGGCCHGHRIP